MSNAGEMMEIRAVSRDYMCGFDLLVYTRKDDGSRDCVTEVETVNRKGGEYCPASFTLTGDAGQQLMDDLYRSGLRPSDMEDGSGTKLHLSDMRKIVASKLGVEL